ncbi:MAG: nitroreductase family protein [Firmicutes bacterium]|nr:nitroreductase family protein [Bacillota bacterium]
MNTTQAIRARRSIRKYLPGATIPQEHVDLMLEAAMCAPSARNKRPYAFVVVENKALLAEIAARHPYAKFLSEASLAIVVCGDPTAYPKPPGQALWPQDCAAATQTVLLQATELGYGSCWSALYPYEERYGVVADILDIRDTVPFSLITLGIADEAPDRRGFFDKAKVRYVR